MFQLLAGKMGLKNLEPKPFHTAFSLCGPMSITLSTPCIYDYTKFAQEENSESLEKTRNQKFGESRLFFGEFGKIGKNPDSVSLDSVGC